MLPKTKYLEPVFDIHELIPLKN